MPLAESLGIAAIADKRALELAVAQLKAHPTLRLSLNVSAVATRDVDWVRALRKLIGGDRVLAERLIVEITETAAVTDIDQIMNFVDTVKDYGCRVAIDDFGAGYTSFRNLKLLNVDMVKIDGCFVRDLATSPDDRVFVQKLAELAQHFGMETVAEWVQDDWSAELLDGYGITYLQGFRYGEPVLQEHKNHDQTPGPLLGHPSGAALPDTVQRSA